MRKRLDNLRQFATNLRYGRAAHIQPIWRVVLKVAFILPLVALVLGSGFVMVSNQPRFCVSCHYMKPFYEAWKKSSHNKVPCVDCHIPPGAKNWIQHKGAAAVQVVKYVTRQYGTRPWVEIDDASCLRAGCHETRLLQGKVNFGGVSFDHGPHLTSFRRVTRLRCTSCHAQIVQGTHMTVTESTCFLCHFKNTKDEPDMARCQRCHTEIKPHNRAAVKSETWGPKAQPTEEPKLKYDHKQVLDRQVDCRSCHNDVVQGSGEVPKDRCLLCHTEPERMKRYNDVEFMHSNHVTKHKVDCQRCHVQVEHKLPPKEQTPQLDCKSCHPDQHAETQALYRGQTGQGTKDHGNPMFDARVPCQGCHVDHQPVNGQPVSLRGGAAGCMMCHGEKYGQALARWEADSQAWTDWARTALQRTNDAIKAAHGPGELGEAPRQLQVARDNVKLVSNGRFIHNPDYAVSLLRVARDRANAALATYGATYRWPPEPPRQAAAQPGTAASSAKCTACHSNVVDQQGYAYGSVFEHRRHVGKAQLPCSTCHSDNASPQSTGHGRLLIGQENCQRCHEQRKLTSPHPQGWRRIHGGTARDNRQFCATCHSQATCDRCHGTKIPHPDNWVHRHQGAAGRESVCAKCHTAKFCGGCHGGARPNDHTSSWPQRHGQAAKSSPRRCARCHDNTLCQSCHGVSQMPHPKGWVTGGHGPVAKKSTAPCARCHQQRFCGQCHVPKSADTATKK